MAEQQAYGLQEGEGEALWFFNSLVTLKASSEQTGGEFCLAEFVGRSDIATPMHAQRHDPETFYVLEGELTFSWTAASGSPRPRARSCTSRPVCRTPSRSTRMLPAGST
jgi:hypothetical protein